MSLDGCQQRPKWGVITECTAYLETVGYCTLMYPRKEIVDVLHEEVFQGAVKIDNGRRLERLSNSYQLLKPRPVDEWEAASFTALA